MKRLGLLLLTLSGCFGESRVTLSEGDAEARTLSEQPPIEALSPCSTTRLPAPLVHLTPRQFRNALKALLGVAPEASLMPPDARVEGYENDSRRGELSAAALSVYVRAVEAVVASAPQEVRPLCVEGEAQEETACIEAWLRTFGRRVFRRPLSGEEVQIYLRLYAKARQDAGQQESVDLVLQALLQSPQFLYWSWQNDDYAIAARMAGFLWSGIPDEALLDAAERGELKAPGTRAEHARRLLADPQAAEASADFHEQYLRLEHLSSAGKDEVLYPLWSPALLEAMREETRRFTARVVASPEGTLHSLLTSPATEVNAALAELYGVEGPPDDRSWAAVTLDPAQRAGVLTQAGLLTTRAHPVTTSPIQRGYFVLERLLCQPLPPPPSSLDLQLPEATPGMTTREFYEPTRTQPACTGCHTMINPLGYAFEHYDPLGAWRDVEGGDPDKVIDAAVELVGHADELSGRIDGAVELTQRLAKSPGVRECYARHWFGYAHAQHVGPEACGMDEVQAAFRESGGNVRALLEAIVSSEAFVTPAEQRCE